MKNNYFLKTVFTFLLCGFFTFSYGADWYISSTGSDDLPNDGSIGAPWKSFSKAQLGATAGDVIHVSGMIDFTLDPANTTTNAGTTTSNKAGIFITKNLTIQGTSASTDGFIGTNGANTTRFFQITNALHTLTLRNLKLANGVAQSTTNAAGGGAIMMTTGNIVAENVVFDGNSAIGYNGITGAAIYIGGSNTIGTSFKNCEFKNNIADKSGAVYINSWGAGTASVPSVILFEKCSFVGNEARNTGGSAIMARSASEYTTLNIINCTFSKNKVTTASNGGTINMGAKGMRYMNMNIINCTITENTTAGSSGNGAGINYVNTTNNNIGNLYIKNSIIENNTTTTGAYSDLNLSAASPTVPETGSINTSTTPVAGYIKIENSFIGAHISTNSNVPTGNVILSQLGYLSTTSTTNDLKAGLAPFNATNNYYPLYSGSAAVGYGNSTFLTSYSTTDQLGNVRTVGATNYAGAWESTPIATSTPTAPTALVATAGDGQVSVAFKSAATGGSNVTNYKYSVNDGSFVTLDPVQTAGPIVITGLTNNTAYTVKLIAVNANGDSPASVASNEATPTGTTALNNPTTAVSIFKNANNQLVVNNASQKTGTVTVYNAMGQRVASVALNASTTTINKTFTSGVYVVTLNIAGNTRSTKIIL
jgi:hypothetical protein